MSEASAARAREKIEEALAKLGAASRSFVARVRSQAGVEPRDLIDPEGEAVLGLCDVEKAPGAASLALPMDLILFETWVLGHLGDHEELDLDVNTHREVWFGLGAWVGETLIARHGGTWLIAGDDPKSWRVGFSKLLLEIAPHAFAEKLIRSGQGMGRRMVAEIERLRASHEQQAAVEGGELRDRFTPHHYARLHSIPLGQWLVVEMARLAPLWNERPVSELIAALGEAAKRLGPENAPAVGRVTEALGQLDADRPAAAQVKERGLFEAVAQMLALKRATAPVPIDVVENVVLPALHVGLPTKFPPLGDDDSANVGRGADLFAVYVDVVPYAHQAEEGGFLGTFPVAELGSPYGDRENLDLAKGDWILVNPARLRRLFDGFDPRKMLATFERFSEHVARQEGVPRVREPGRGLAQQTARALTELRACLGVLDRGSALVFRLLPPPA